MQKRPLVGIAARIFNQGTKQENLGVFNTYIRAISTAGGSALLLPPKTQEIPRYLSFVDGLLLTGGGDIHPKFFGKRSLNVKLDLSPDERTQFELAISKAFLKAKLPILGICLGCQTLNVALGGTLILDLSTEHPDTKDHTNGSHWISILPDSKLCKIFNTNKIQVNSRHHQAIGKLGKDLSVSAISPDKVIEAIESKGRPFAIGLQWHPEEIPKSRFSKKLFQTFIKECQNKTK